MSNLCQIHYTLSHLILTATKQVMICDQLIFLDEGAWTLRLDNLGSHSLDVT